MSEDGSTYTVTMKRGGGYEEPWVVVRADSPVELEQNLTALQGELLLKVTQTANRFAATILEDVPPKSPQVSSSGQDASMSQGGGVSNIPTCDHGKRVEKSGTSAKGKWKGYFCALPKGTAGACSPVWAD